MKNILIAFVLMVLVLYGAAVAGGVGSVELAVWVALTAIVLVLTGSTKARRSVAYATQHAAQAVRSR